MNSTNTLRYTSPNSETNKHDILLSSSSIIDRIVYWLIILFTFSLPWENVIILPYIGTLTRLFASILIAFWALNILRSQKLRDINWYYFFIFVFLTWATASVLWSFDPIYALIRLATLAQTLLITVVYWNIIVDRNRLGNTLQAYIFGSYVTIAILIFNYIIGNVTLNERRASLANSNENNIGLILALGLPLAWYLATKGANLINIVLWQRILNFAYIPLGLVGVMLTASRGSFVATMPFFFYLPLLARQLKPKYRWLSILATVIVLIGAYYYTPESSLNRIMTIQSEIEQGDFNARADIWADGIDAIMNSARVFVVGGGVGNYPVIVGRDAHNTLLTIFLELGLIGLLLFFVLMVILARIIIAFQPAERLMWGTLMAVWFIGNLNNTWLYTKGTWIFMALIVCCGAINLDYQELDASSSDDEAQM